MVMRMQSAMQPAEHISPENKILKAYGTPITAHYGA